MYIHSVPNKNKSHDDLYEIEKSYHVKLDEYMYMYSSFVYKLQVMTLIQDFI